MQPIDVNETKRMKNCMKCVLGSFDKQKYANDVYYSQHSNGSSRMNVVQNRCSECCCWFFFLLNSFDVEEYLSVVLLKLGAIPSSMDFDPFVFTLTTRFFFVSFIRRRKVKMEMAICILE